jgi:hypothetical protein
MSDYNKHEPLGGGGVGRAPWKSTTPSCWPVVQAILTNETPS